MVAGVIFILCGILIALYPPLLSMIVAVLLILMGAFLVMVGYRYKRSARSFDDPFLDFFMKL